MNTAHVAVLAVFVLVLMLPGLLIGAAAGIRGWLLVGAAPVLTYGAVGLAAPLVPQVFGRWSWVGLLVAAAVLALVLLGVRLMTRRVLPGWHALPAMPSTWGAVHHVGVAAGIAGAGAVGVMMMRRGSHDFGGVHQFWDAVFHVNATRFIIDTGQSAPSALRAVNAPEYPNFYYPNGYHVINATVGDITGASIPELVNLHAALFPGLLALTLVALVRVLNGRPALAVTTALLACAFGAFPAGTLYFGPLWPFSAGIVLIPAFLALFAAAVEARDTAILMGTAIAAAGVVAAHPSAALATGIFGVALLVQRWITARSVPLRDIGALALFGAFAVLYVVPQMLSAMRSAGNIVVSWPTFTTPGRALGDLLFLNFDQAVPQWWLVAAMVIGLAAVRRLRGLGWLVVAGAFFVVLFMLAAAYKGWVVSLLTNPWWNDAWRFAALAVPAQVVLAAHGVVSARDVVLAAVGRFRPRAAGWVVVRSGVLALGLAVLVIVTSGLYHRVGGERIARAYGNGPGVGTFEREAMAELGRIVPEGVVVMNDPYDGSAWMWALNDVRPVFGHAFNIPDEYKVIGPDRVALHQRFNRIDTDREIQDIVERLDIGYVYIGAGYLVPGERRAPGMTGLDDVDALELVYRNVDASIYEVRVTSGG